METEKAYRDSIFTKVSNFLEVVKENVLLQDSGEHTQAMELFLSNLNKMVTTMHDVKDSNAFVSVAKGLDMVLENEFFSHIHGPKAVPVSVRKEMKKEDKRPASADKEENFNIQTHIIGIDDPNKVPMAVRLKLAQALRAMGLPESEINSQLNLGGM